MIELTVRFSYDKIFVVLMKYVLNSRQKRLMPTVGNFLVDGNELYYDW